MIYQTEKENHITKMEKFNMMEILLLDNLKIIFLMEKEFYILKKEMLNMMGIGLKIIINIYIY